MNQRVTGCYKKWLMEDRNGKPIHVGDKIRYQYCVGRYGQTAISETTVTENHYEYGRIADAEFHLDFNRMVLVGKYKHNDYEHGHETWIEVLRNGKDNHQ